MKGLKPKSTERTGRIHDERRRYHRVILRAERKRARGDFRQIRKLLPEYHSWNAIPPKRPNCLKTFVGKIARNVSLKRLEKAQAVKRGGGEAAIAIDELEECVADISVRDAEQIEEDMVIREVLDQFQAGLSKQNRRVFMRRYWYCSSVREISLAFGLTESNVKTSLSRSRGKLKEALEKAGVVL